MAVNITRGCVHQFNNLDAMAYVIGLVSLIAVVQNILTIVTIYRTVALHTVTNMIIVSMNIGDTFLAVSFLVISVIFYPGLINLSNSTCVDTFVLGLVSFTEALACFHFGVVAIDRYIYISHPFVYIRHVTRNVIIKVIIGCWLVATINLWLPLIVYRSDSYHTFCILMNPPKEYFSAILFVYLAILIIVFICDFKIARLAFRRKKGAIVQRNITSIQSSVSGNISKSAIRSVKFFALNFGIFSVFTLPTELITIISYCIPVSYYIHVPIMCVYVLNQIVGFYVHIYMCKEFHHGLNKLLQP